jgi:hypothetical protein
MSTRFRQGFRKVLLRRLADEENSVHSTTRKHRTCRLTYVNILVVLFVSGILIAQLSFPPPSILPRTEGRDVASLDTPLTSLGSKDSEGTSVFPNADAKSDANTNADASLGSIDSNGTSASTNTNTNTNTDANTDDSVFEKFIESTPLTNYSYGTTDVNEFTRLHSNYLLSKQQELNNSYLSTKARGKDANGNNVTTYSFACWYCQGFIAGFRNQIMGLVALVMIANYEGHEQLLFESVRHKDAYGTNKFNPFAFYFDVEHWNRYSYNEEKHKDEGTSRFPNWLPRLVFYDPDIHDEWDPSRFAYKENATKTRPYGFTNKGTSLVARYLSYVKGKGKLHKDHRRNPAEIIMLQGALRPNPALQAIVDRSKKYLLERAHSTKSSFRYMTLHARVEPDMQNHPVCRDKKVLNLQEIVDMIESKWEEPPVDAVFMPINRQYLEKKGTLPKNFKNDTIRGDERNWIAVDNLQLLNRLTNHDDSKDGKYVSGMWNGKVPVIEFGSEALGGSVYEHRPSTSGSILNYFLGLDGHIFIGTEVSSFSHDLLAARFFRAFNESDTSAAAQTSSESDSDSGRNLRKNNYKYLPGGLEEWITDDMVDPPEFHC